jgi:hypothetical protein
MHAAIFWRLRLAGHGSFASLGRFAGRSSDGELMAECLML